MTDPSFIIGMCPYQSLMADLWSKSSSISFSALVISSVMRVTSSFFSDSAMHFSRLWFSPKFLLFTFLLLLPSLSLCPLSAAPAWGWPAQEIHPCSSHCNRGLQCFCGIPTLPSPNRKMSPSTFPMTQICRGNNIHYIKYIIQYDHKINKYSELIEEFLPNWHCTIQASSCKETLHELGKYYGHSRVTMDSSRLWPLLQVFLSF